MENGHADTLKEALNHYLEDLRFQRIENAVLSSAAELRHTVTSAFDRMTSEISRQGESLRGEIADYNAESLAHTKAIENSVRTLEYYETMKMLNGYYG